MNKGFNKKKKTIFTIAGFVIVCLFMLMGFIGFRVRGSTKVSAKEDIELPEEIAMYRQDDKRWFGETLGDSDYTMGKSGCLVTCIASALTMSGKAKTPDVLNTELSSCHVFDTEGNLLWENLKNMGEYEVDVFQEVKEETLIACLKDGRYPIVRVRMYGIGNFHYVLIVGAEGGEFYCMDPLEDKLTILSKYADRVYAIRCISL